MSNSLPMEELSARLAGGELILLDGATGTELERRGVPMDAAAWSAASLITHPQKYYGALTAVLDVLVPLGGMVAHVMHTDVMDVLPALSILKQRWSGPVGVYAHSGRFVMPHWQFNDVISPEDYLAEARRWVEAGAQLVGGCCGIGPDHIRLLKQELPAHVPGR